MKMFVVLKNILITKNFKKLQKKKKNGKKAFTKLRLQISASLVRWVGDQSCLYI